MQTHLTQIKCPDSNSEINLIKALNAFAFCLSIFYTILIVSTYYVACHFSRMKYFILSELTKL